MRKPLRQRHLLLIAAGQRAECAVHVRRADAQPLHVPLDATPRSTFGRSHRRLMRSSMAIVMFLNTGSVANSIIRRLSGRKAMPARRARVAEDEPHAPPIERDPSALSRQSAEQRARQLELPGAEKSVDSQHLALAHLQRHVIDTRPRGSVRRPPARPSHPAGCAAECRTDSSLPALRVPRRSCGR